MATLGVHSHHLNVGQGDSAIHLLVERTGRDAWTVLSAVLIDGGPGIGFPVLHEAIAAIPVLYKVVTTWNGTAQLQFDSIVVTHWDEDHYEGLERLFASDLQKQLKGATVDSAKDLRSKYMKYDENDNNAPLTYFYAPYWEKGESNDVDQTKQSPPSWAREVDSNKKFLNIFVNHTKTGEDWALKVANLCTETGFGIADEKIGMIGRNFFQNGARAQADILKIGSPAGLLTGTPPANLHGLYCIGADSIVIGHGNVLPPPKRRKKDIADIPGVVDGGGKDTPVNRSSIICIILNASGVILHYFGGDAAFESENAVNTWIGDVGSRILGFKLGHHGAATSSPTLLLQNLVPETVVVSCGAEYGHPRYEVLLYLAALLNWAPGDILSTCYPYWFDLQSHFKVNALFKNDAFYATWRDQVQTMALGPKTSSSFTPLNGLDFGRPPWSNLTSATAMKNEVIDFCKYWWPTRSRTTEEYTVMSCATNILSKKHGCSTFVGKSDQLVAWTLQFENEGKEHYDLPWDFGTDQLVRLNYIPCDITEGRKPLPPRTHFPSADVGPAGNTRYMVKAFRGGRLPVAARPATDPKAIPIKRDRDNVARALDENGDFDSPIFIEPPTVAPTTLTVTIPKVSSTTTPSCFVSSTWKDFLQYLTSDQLNSPFVLLSEGSMDNVVMWLSNATVELAFDDSSHSLVQPGTAGQGPTPISLASYDQWWQWMRLFQNITPVENFQFHALTTNNPWQLTGFTLTIDAQISLGNVFPLTFSTSAASSQLQPATANPDGTVDHTALVILGLQDGGRIPSNFTLSQVATLIQFQSNSPPAPGGTAKFSWGVPLYGLADSIKLTLDTGVNAAGEGPRNCIWFSSADAYETHLRLQFKIVDSNSVLSWLTPGLLKNISFTRPPVVIARKMATPRAGFSDFMDVTDGHGVQQVGAMGMQFKSQIMINLALKVGTFDFELFFILGLNSGELVFVNTNQSTTAGSMSSMLSAFEKAISVPGSENLTLPDITSLLPGWADPTGIILREVRVVISTDSPMRLLSVQVEFEVPLNVGSGKTAFHLYFSWPNTTFFASLWVPPAPMLINGVEWTSTTSPVRCLPEYESYMYLELQNPQQQTTSISLVDLIPGRPGHIDHPPEGLDLQVKQLSLQVSLKPQLLVQFRAGIGSSDENSGSVPPIVIDTLDLMASYDNTTLSLSLLIALDIVPATIPTDGPTSTQLTGQFEYDDGLTAEMIASSGTSRWSFTGRIQALKFGWLTDFMDPLVKDFLAELLAEVYVQYLNVNYSYQANTTEKAVASSFSFDGFIQISELTFQLLYSYDNTGWEFRAALGGSSKATDLKTVLLKFCDPKVVDLIPDFCSITLGDAKTADAAANPPSPRGQPAGLDEILVIHNTKAKRPYVLFVLNLTLKDGHNLTFVQIRYDQSSDGTPTPPPPKRIAKFTLKEFPSLSNPVPAVSSLPQPFDEMEFVWVHDDSGQGIQRSDIAAINDTSILPQDLWIPYKDTFTQPPGSQPNDTDVLLSVGCHFIVSQDSNAILDYCFGAPAPSSSSTIVHPKAIASPDPPPTTGNESTPPTMSPLRLTFGPLSIANIGLQVSGESLSIHLDATLQIGPIGFGVLNLRLVFSSPGKWSLSDFENVSIDAYLDGLQADFDQPPLTIAGLFVHQDGIYKGGVDISMDPYMFMAVGTYGQLKQDAAGQVWPASENPPNPPVGNVNEFKSIFIYGELDGPILDLGFMQVVGVRLGFGYNSILRNPDLSVISIFPFLDTPSVDPTSSSSQNPLELLSSFCAPVAATDPTPWVSPKNDTLWFAMGLTIVAFELLTVTTIIVVDLQPSVVLNVFADAIAAMPGDGTDPQDSFVYVEIQIVASINFDMGTMMADGKLAPNSFVLDPACHLGGQFGMRNWFGNSPYAGNWVYTVGGYHPAYNAPSYYPKCDRMTISWELDSNLSITGEAYFAITPKVAMGGGSLSAVFNLGPLSAHFDAYADFLINFNKFYFQGDIGVDVGIDFSMDLLFVTLDISCDINVDLFIEGPAFGGVAHVDFWVFGFDIAFGNPLVTPAALTWAEFWDLLVQDTTEQSSAMRANDFPTASPNTKFVLGLVSGAIPSNAQMRTLPQGGPPAPSSLGAVTKITPAGPVTGSPPPPADPGTNWLVRAGTFSFRVETKVPFTEYSVNTATPTKIPSKDCQFSMKPMRVSDFVARSTLTVNVTSGNSSLGIFRVTVISKNAPSSIWSQYNSKADPSAPGGDYTDLLSPKNPTISLPMALEILVPKPQLLGMIPAFNAGEALTKDVVTMDGNANDPSIPCSAPNTPVTCLPGYRCSADGSDLDNAWKTVEKLWPASLPQRGPAIDKWIAFFGWGGENLTLAPPNELILDLEEVFLGAPFVCNKNV